MINKLIFSQKFLLEPLVKQLQADQNQEQAAKLSQVEIELNETKNKQANLQHLWKQELIEKDFFAKQDGVAVIFSSHNMNNVTAVSDKILMLVNGEQRLYGPINQIRSQFEKNKVYLEGIFDHLSPINFNGVLHQKNDYPGKVLTFNSEKMQG